ncbi:MAG TPA: hypothetical protein DD670_14695 [Planctomycetaceae bacterium]|nr:hypothetical protein [Planctomycetaceae bacterium]
MSIGRWLIGGIVGGAIGVAIWVAVGYFTGYEVGFIAWGVGFIVGLGVRAGAQQDEGIPPGVTAVALAVVAILLAKYAVIHLHVSDALADVPAVSLTDEDMIAAHAAAIVEKTKEAGNAVDWPTDNLPDNAPAEKYFPPEIWAKGKAEWESLSDEVKAAEKASQKERTEAIIGQVTTQLRANASMEGFKASFTPIDLLWFGLAALTAFKLGSGMAGSDE